MEIGFVALPVRSMAASRVAGLPPIHRGPFDRILMVQATSEPATLLTADERLLSYSELIQRVGVR